MPDWSRLLTARDPAERAALRTVLIGAIKDADETAKRLPQDLAQQVEVLIQRGVAQAFKKH